MGLDRRNLGAHYRGFFLPKLFKIDFKAADFDLVEV